MSGNESEHATYLAFSEAMGERMRQNVYEHLLEMNRGFDQVLRNLKALAKYPALRPDEIRRFEQLSREARAATNSHVLDALARIETAEAGRQQRKRRKREQQDERA